MARKVSNDFSGYFLSLRATATKGPQPFDDVTSDGDNDIQTKKAKCLVCFSGVVLFSKFIREEEKKSESTCMCKC